MSTGNGEAGVTSAVEDAEKFDFGSKVRHLGSWQKAMVGALCVLYAAFHLAVLNVVQLDAWVFRALHVNVAAVIAFALYAPFGRPGTRVPAFDWALSAVALGAAGYIWWNLEALVLRTGVLMTTTDVVVATLGIVAVIEFARRTSGLALPILAGLFILYGFCGPWLPGVLYHRGYGFGEFTTFVYSMEGIFGITTAAAALYIVLFVLFAAFLQVSKVGDFFMNLAFGAFGRLRGGPAKVSLFGSILFGMISGSGVANVVASGTFTIPVMKRVGYRPASAGAIEAAASTGGQLTPPIMGAGAFIMAEVTGIPYTTIIAAALIPCLLYYFAVYIHIDLEARKEGIEGLPRSELPKLRPMARDAFVLAPLALLIVFLFAGFSIISAGSWGIAVAVLVMLQQRLGIDSRVHAVPILSVLATVMLVPGLSANSHGLIATGAGLLAVLALAARGARAEIGGALQGTLADVIEALSIGTRQSLQLAAVCACAGIVVGVIGLTGLGGRFSSLLLGVAGQSEFFALVFAMLIALILGMGMPTTAAYAIAASVVAPALQRMGLGVLPVHLFIFYYAVISTITPPIALSAFAGAALAGADPWKTSFKAVRYGIAAFIVPFLFIHNQGVLLEGSLLEIVRTTLTATIGVWALATASEGWLSGRLPVLFRLGFAVAALLLIAGDIYTDLAGLVLCGALVALRLARARAGRAA
ncbi:TRAP transporter fused permease subunit [Rhodobacter sphaeroides]|uniref:TRAP transporter permease n=1 Tax=Cereibacter sphaeroides TaxID=1063 RepID=UPI001325A3E7|nr:TRAP transporter permease [Cereibacter sphaeroides]MWP38514.1 TRAP transporter fused permease subunit [Cereibacter sphaeroides]